MLCEKVAKSTHVDLTNLVWRCLCGQNFINQWPISVYESSDPSRQLHYRNPMIAWDLICPAQFSNHSMTFKWALSITAMAVQSPADQNPLTRPGVALCEGQWRGLGPSSVLTVVVIRLIDPTCASFANINKKDFTPWGCVTHMTSEGLIIVRREALWC